jgi:hypothetical protein
MDDAEFACACAGIKVRSGPLAGSDDLPSGDASNSRYHATVPDESTGMREANDGIETRF